jgi:aryl-alcohol dehydrogenase-like predicted oxidoreductase
MTFGGESFFAKTGNVGVKEARRMVDIAADHGVNLVDTANMYSFGQCEEIVGEVMEGRHADMLIATKVRMVMGNRPNDGGLSRHHIIDQCEKSLKRLRRNHIDLYFLHEWDGQTPVEEMMEALDTLIRSGKVRYAGCSNFSGWHIMKALMAADRHNYQRFVCQQIHYSLESRDAEYELLPIAVDQGVAIQVWSPIAGGLLSGKFRRDAPSPVLSRHLEGWGEPPVRDKERLFRIIDALVEIGKARGVSAAQVAISWLFERPGVNSLVLGARTEEQLIDSLASASLMLTPDERKQLDQVSQPPLLYPYWHQAKTAKDRLSAADMALLSPHTTA